jgi:hypothetical protein
MLVFLQALLEVTLLLFSLLTGTQFALVLWVFPLIFFWLALSNLRAALYWRAAQPNARTGFSIIGLLTPRALYRVSDFFLLQAQSTDLAFLHRRWAIIWEVPFLRSGRVAREFAEQHTYKYSEKKRLDQKLARMNDQMAIAARFNRRLDPVLVREYVEICRRLWVITGKSSYRDLERRIGSNSSRANTTANTSGPGV